MTTYEAIMIAEGAQDSSVEDYIKAWQTLIDTNLCWQLQGWFGREATRMIEENLCHAAHARVNSDPM
jgi:hypothetical protein